MNERKNMLTVVDGETLMDMKLPPTKFCVERCSRGATTENMMIMSVSTNLAS